jgi:hypothetical protein
MLDWRYEGIVMGYINLYRKTKQQVWLDKAKRAALDLTDGQYPCGNYRYSSFERGAVPGGTPHEAGADIALLNLAKLLQEESNSEWLVLYKKAANNIENYLLRHLWTGEYFRNLPGSKYYVANKSATILEALLLYYDFLCTLDHSYAKRVMSIITKTADSIVRLGLSGGGIAHSSTRRDSHVFYTARCLWPLAKLYEVTSKENYLKVAEQIAHFISQMRRPEGGFYQVQYHNGKIGKYPIWIAACGDILHALSTINGLTVNYNELIEINTTWLLRHQDSCGAIRTSHGFGIWLGNQNEKQESDFNDILHVCGWNDKAFRFLSSLLAEGSNIPPPNTEPCQVDCFYNGKKAIYYEDENQISVWSQKGRKPLYHWNKKDKLASLTPHSPLVSLQPPR